MLLSIVPSFAGLLALALLPKDREDLLWSRWGCYFITSLGTVTGPCKSHLHVKIGYFRASKFQQYSGHWFRQTSLGVRKSPSLV